jgi:hypothetical protein
MFLPVELDVWPDLNTRHAGADVLLNNADLPIDVANLRAGRGVESANPRSPVGNAIRVW